MVTHLVKWSLVVSWKTENVLKQILDLGKEISQWKFENISCFSLAASKVVQERKNSKELAICKQNLSEKSRAQDLMNWNIKLFLFSSFYSQLQILRVR